MNQNILKFLKKYSYNPLDINRIIVSSFLITNNIINPKNEFIRKYIITNDENELQQLNEFILLFKDLDFNIEKLIKLFEFVISPADKEVNGAVYTPRYIRDYIVNETLRKFDNNKNIDEIIFGDIACGCGGFFVTIAETIKNKTKKKYFDIYSENIYGLDIQGYSIERTKILLSLLAISEGEDYPNIQFNLFEGNALGFDWKTVPAINENLGFDIILGNPPYVGATKIDKESKSLLKNWSVSKSGKSDLYIPFFEIGMVNLNSAGILGYITVNTFYKSLNGRSVRSYFSKNKFDLSIVDFGGEQLFKSRSTYTCICIIGKEQSSKIKYIKTTSDSVNRLKNKDFISIPYSSLNDFEGWYLNEKQTNNLILKIEATGKPLGTIFEIRNGFATLKNNIYVFRPIKESEDFFYLNKDGIEYKIEKDICRNTIKPNTLKSESEIENNTETLIFPYLYEETHDLFGKNSRLLKILDETFFKKKFPFAYKYLETQKEVLSNRDKGERQYEEWYAFGRNQALTFHGYKLLFPYISSSPCFVLTEDKDLLFYNGYAIISKSIEDLLFLQKILMSDIFWFYIKNTSKPYSGNYFSLAKNYVKNFGICNLTNKEKEKLIKMTNQNKINEFLFQKYDIQKSDFVNYSPMLGKKNVKVKI